MPQPVGSLQQLLQPRRGPTLSSSNLVSMLVAWYQVLPPSFHFSPLSFSPFLLAALFLSFYRRSSGNSSLMPQLTQCSLRGYCMYPSYFCLLFRLSLLYSLLLLSLGQLPSGFDALYSCGIPLYLLSSNLQLLHALLLLLTSSTMVPPVFFCTFGPW